MGAACCCLMIDCDEFADPNSSVCRNCICLRCVLQSLLHVYASLFRREELVLASPSHGMALSSTASLDNSLANIYRSPPRPLPYNVDPRIFRLQRDGLVSRREKSSSHAHEETEPLRANEVEESELSSNKSKWNEFSCEEGLNDYSSKLSRKISKSKSADGFAHIYTSAEDEDEDVCPTCLEEYTAENPKTITNCSHHFHLGCIYEWMERSDNCPVCGQVMAFDETT